MGEWSPSHTILVIFIVVGFIGQVAIYFYRTAQNDKKIDKQSEDIKQQGETFFHALERLEDRMDKRFVEVINTMNQQISDVRADMNQRFSEMQGQIEGVRDEIAGVRSEMNQRLSDMQDDTNHRFAEVNHRFAEVNQRLSEMNATISDVRSEMRQLNQNHIEHLNRHHG